MKHIPLVLCLLFSTPAMAQSHDDESLSQIERGAQMLMEELLRTMDPALDDLQDLMREFGPALRGLLDRVEDWSVYETPEILENGDIIIRRKPKADDPVSADPEAQIDI